METERDTLGKVQAIATIVSAIAIPILIAIFGWIIQAELSSQTLDKDYVQIAVKVLQDKSDDKDNELREWATSIVDRNSPIPLSAKAREEKDREGKLVLFFMPSPPDVLMEGPEKPILLATGEPVSMRDFALNVLDNYGICRVNDLKLKHLQEWIRIMQNIYSKQNQEIGITDEGE